MGRILDEHIAPNAVRAICLPGADPVRAALLIPDEDILGPDVLIPAEAEVIARLGSDWAAITAGTAPAVYAGGDPVSAQALLADAVVALCCARLVVRLRQLVPTQEKTQLVGVTRDLSWDAMEQSFRDRASDALNLLVRPYGDPLFGLPPLFVVAHGYRGRPYSWHRSPGDVL